MAQRARAVWPYPAMLPYSVKVYPIVQVSDEIGPQRPGSWPPAMDPRVAAWAERIDRSPAHNQLYLHVPFCPFLCHFCPLYKHPATGDRNKELKAHFVEALKREIAMVAPAHMGTPFQSVYFGGGTPTELTAEELGDLLATLRSNFCVTADAEITLEGVARQMLSDGYIETCIGHGFNRFSFGVQTTDPALRKRIGRGDSVNDYPALISLIRKLAPGASVNVDFMAGLPEQTFESIETDIDVIRRWDVNSVDVLYYVMLPGTRLRKLVQLGTRPSPDSGERLLEVRQLVNQSLAKREFVQRTGEVFVRDDENRFVQASYGGGVSCVNTVLGLGPSAFGITDGFVYQNVCDLDLYLKQINERLIPVQRGRRLTVQLARRRAVIFSIMRLNIDEALVDDSSYRSVLNNWQRNGLICRSGRSYLLTEMGRLWYNHMQIDCLPFTDVLSTLRMFGSIEEQNQMLKKSQSELSQFEREVLTLIGGRRLKTIRHWGYRTFLAIHRAAGLDGRAIGFTGAIESGDARH